MSRYMKKWWIEKILDPKENIIFKGWINTVHSKKEDIPEMITGTMYAYKNDIGLYGRFELDNPNLSENKDSNYVIGSAYKVTNLDHIDPEYRRYNREIIQSILDSTKPLKTFPRFDARLEDCIILEKTYVTEF